MQIRTKLTLLFLFITAGILAGVLSVVFFLFKKHTENVFFQGLQSKADMTAQTALQNSSAFRPLPHNWFAPDNDSLPYRDNISVFDDSYERVFSVRPDGVPVSVKALQDAYSTGETRLRHFNLYALARAAADPKGRPYVVVVEGYCDPTQLFQLRNILIISFVFGMALIAVFGWYYAGRALAPVSRMTDSVNALQPSDLSRRVVSEYTGDELGRLADTFNRLLDRVERAFRMQRMFLSNVSHELKNPLTAIRSQLEVALQRERSPEAYRTTLQSVLDDVHNMSEVEEKLLQLARIYNDPSAIPFGPVRLDELMWQAREQVIRRHPSYKVALDMGEMPESETTLVVQGNEALLRSALLNLMDNGCKYSPDHQVRVYALFSPDGQHQIEVHDHGPGIPPEEQALIFEPFFRSPRHLQVKGTGIGLSLTQSILSLHHIDLQVESPTGGGALFRLRFGVSINERNYLGRGSAPENL